jgi:antitoxin component of MazEF toxin-antitoxin module
MLVKIRRVGNSNVISLPRALEERGFTPGTTVLLDILPTGELQVVPAVTVRRISPERARQLVEENREALDLLAEHDGPVVERTVAAGSAEHLHFSVA